MIAPQVGVFTSIQRTGPVMRFSKFVTAENAIVASPAAVLVFVRVPLAGGVVPSGADIWSVP